MHNNSTFSFKSIWLLLMLFLLTLNLYSQQRVTITGTVTSADGLALPGVSVRLKGTTIATMTNPKGNFSLSIPGLSGMLEFSSIGYKGQEVAIRNSGTYQVTMQEDAAGLSEVVVVGYGTTRKKDLTGSIAVVTSKDFQQGNITTPEQMLAGKVPGVSITSNGGQPGSGSTIRIRGGSSLNASNDPLIVIDGVPLQSGGVSGATNPLTFINPDDVESFTILKDASAAAIYGARAANGVIIITTKKGVGGDFKVGFNTINSMSKIIKEVKVLDGDQFRTVVNANGTQKQKDMLGAFNTNWQDLIYQDGLATDNNVSMSGGIKKLPYRLSVGYQNQTGILKTDELQKTTVAFVLNPTFFDNHLKIDLNLKGSALKTRFANQAAIGAAVGFDPTQAVYTNRSDYNGYWEWLDPTTPSGLVNLVVRNPVGLLEQRQNRSTPLRSIGNLQLDYKFHFLPDLHANLNAGYDIAEGKGTTFVNQYAAETFNRQGINTQYRQDRRNTVLEFYLNYVKEFKSIKSRVDATAGYSYNDYLTKIFNFADFDANGNKILNSEPVFPFDKPQNRLISYFGRLNYNYDERFLLTATIRRDGSSRFGPNYKNAVFPSVAAAWTLKNEDFMRENKTFSALKLRLSYGTTGQQDGIGNYGYLSTYSLSTPTAAYQFGNEFYQMYRPSAYIYNIKWEQTATTNVGVDMGFLDNRITASVDWYYKKTSDLLNLVPQPAGTNFSATAVVNVGDMENRGVELALNVVPVKGADFNWDFNFNATYNKNTITNLTVIPKDKNYVGAPVGPIAGGVSGQYAMINAVGSGKNTFYLFQQVYDQSGRPVEGVYIDQNGDGLINQNDFHKGKSADPKFFLGFSNNLNYKKWSLNFVMRANIGNYVYNNISSQTGNWAQIGGSAVLYNASPSYLATNFKAQQLFSDYYIENASFLKMDNVSLGYRFGKVFHSKVGLQVNAGIQNVFTITNYSGLDPEVSSGIDNNLYPRPRVFSLGLNLNY
ncbi:MAG: TonB-dependent receptor [Candidatus Pedobacter colombiensis]|uniref:TonB-dependent receptor n=1 Tax=Candidatus Pedobacter colombiensis TaxID=3121371 RepID=A0AAJ6B8M1_9SPHI|nr:TonB-dependent receptor [Pedobacter sp.]WEK21034.1 MAG: TonB-dependent receptor [Pedobacter sp.]